MWGLRGGPGYRCGHKTHLVPLCGEEIKLLSPMILARALPNVQPYDFGPLMGIAGTGLRGTAPLSTRLTTTSACADLER